MTLWFFGVGAAAALESRELDSAEKRKTYSWHTLILYITVPLSAFAFIVYPRIKPSWGGGSPVAVFVYFSPDSRIMPGQQMNAELLDESDSGFYIARHGERQALFIPRVDVSALYFSPRPLDPEFTRPLTKPKN